MQIFNDIDGTKNYPNGVVSTIGGSKKFTFLYFRQFKALQFGNATLNKLLQENFEDFREVYTKAPEMGRDAQQVQELIKTKADPMVLYKKFKNAYEEAERDDPTDKSSLWVPDQYPRQTNEEITQGRQLAILSTTFREGILGKHGNLDSANVRERSANMRSTRASNRGE